MRGLLDAVLTASLKDAAKEQGLERLGTLLAGIVPDISGQYTTFRVDTPYLERKVRNMHAFQISLVNDVLEKYEKATIVDIGDSAGSHLYYILQMNAGKKDLKCVGVNLDAKAVEKIKARGLTAINARAEDLHKHDIKADIFLCYETLEHIADPCNFLHSLSSNTNARYMVVTVPYVRRSRAGLHHIRAGRRTPVSAENTHIFELSPEDLKLIARHSGWKIAKEKIYLQYPRWSLLRSTQPLWKSMDFEGFYGLVLEKDDTWSSLYKDW
ncbi:MAG: methyltransferase domain-containing protein [Dehalococcoidales bacterium]|jgi:2-polyprenyl-3-methyl-5-hydroxy-6-metoxy-1,4-benzoquinol methylase